MTESEAQVASRGRVAPARAASWVTRPVQPDMEVSQAAVASLAHAHIARRMHDPDLEPGGDPCQGLGISRTSLYRAFAEAGGIAAAIRDARLDLARRRLERRGTTR